MQKIFIGDNNLTTITCPRCGKSKDIDVSPYLGSKSSARITFKFKCKDCDCGHKTCEECKENNCSNGNTNLFQLERRKFFRKKVDLAGTLFDREGKKHAVRLLDLSRTGLKMSMLAARPIIEGQRLRIEFKLDDAKESHIRKEIIVRKVAEKVISGQFTDNQNYDHDDKLIGFYLMK